MGESEVSEYTKELAKGSIWGIAGNIASNLVSFFYIILIARAVSQDDLGLFYLSLSIVTIISVFTALVDISLARYIPYFEGRNEKGKIRNLLKLSYRIVAVLALILIAALWLASDFIGEAYHNPGLPEAIRMLSALVLLNGLFRINTEFLRGRSDIKSMQINMNLQNFLKLVLTFAFFYFYGASVFTLSAGYLVSILLGLLFSFLSVSARKRDLPKEENITKSQFLLDILPFGIVLSAIGYVGTLISSADAAILGYLTVPAEATTAVAIYAVSVLLATIAAIFPNSMGSIFLPVASRLYGKKNLDEMRAVTETIQRWLLFITAPVAGILIFFSEEMLTVFYGAAYAGGAFVMSMYVLGVLIKCISAMFSIILTSMKKMLMQLLIIGSLAIFHLALDVLLIPVYGMNGIGIAFLMESILIAVIFSYYTKKVLKFRFSKEFYKLLFAIVALFLIGVLLRPVASYAETLLPEYADYGIELYISKLVYLAYLVVLSAMLFAIFMSLVLLLRCFRKEDRTIMRKVMQKAKIPEVLISKLENIMSYGIAK